MRRLAADGSLASARISASASFSSRRLASPIAVRSPVSGGGGAAKTKSMPQDSAAGGSAEIAAVDDDVGGMTVARVIAGDAFRQRENRFAGGFVDAGAGAQGLQARGQVAQILGDDMDDAFLALQPAPAIDKRRAEHGAAEALEDWRPDDQIGDAGFVFDGHEDDPLGAAWALADQHETGDRNPALDRQSGKRVGGDDAFLGQFVAQKGERVAFQAKTRAAVILDDVFTERHRGQKGCSDRLIAIVIPGASHSEGARSPGTRTVPVVPSVGVLSARADVHGFRVRSRGPLGNDT